MSVYYVAVSHIKKISSIEMYLLIKGMKLLSLMLLQQDAVYGAVNNTQTYLGYVCFTNHSFLFSSVRCWNFANDSDDGRKLLCGFLCVGV